MSNKYSTNFPRGFAIMNFILEGSGHTIVEASKEFNLAKSTIAADLKCVEREAFYGYRLDAKRLQEKYIKMKKTLKRLEKEHKSAN